MTVKQIPVSVYAEATPNPATMKFVADRLLIENGAQIEFLDADEVTNSPLANALFNFPFVEAIFFAGNFVTIAKTDIIEWMDVQVEMREFVQTWLRDGKPVFEGNPEAFVPEAKEDVPFEEVVPKTEIEEQLVMILEEYVRPAVEQDGGAIHFKSYKDNILTVVLKGSCSGCPSSSGTLKNGIASLLERMVPEVKDVVAEEQ